MMNMDRHVLEIHCELAAQALEGIAFQASAQARFLRMGEQAAAVETYRRVVGLFREFVSPEMQIIAAAAPDATVGEAAIEWRDNRPSKRGGAA